MGTVARQPMTSTRAETCTGGNELTATGPGPTLEMAAKDCNILKVKAFTAS